MKTPENEERKFEVNETPNTPASFNLAKRVGCRNFLVFIKKHGIFRRRNSVVRNENSHGSQEAELI